ncbi:TauD/TfdA dioxygenase family protein [Burkholderia pseudomallei]|uniref:TauD/TfdA dioxygenase family protein n=1 Tax=Burkholderia pseudomallei TaxID=28450 RepID=UPI0009762EF0|nr:TauD/TfdA family dioxygenase [Burkholderia pseudomallei]
MSETITRRKVAYKTLSNALGTEVYGFDSPFPHDAEAVRALIEAWHVGGICRLRRQRLDMAEFVEFSRIFGRPERALNQERKLTSREDLPELMIVSNILENGVSIGHLGSKEAYWHTDMCYTDVPPIASILYAIEVPAHGGNTEFMNMYRVHDALPASLRRQIAGLSIKHDRSYTAVGELRYGFDSVVDVTTCPGSIHPIVRVHPVTQRPYLYLGRRLNAYVVGLPVGESEALLDELWRYTRLDGVTWTQRWEVGDIMIWDNRCTMHRRDAFDANARRLMWRTQIQADPARPL